MKKFIFLIALILIVTGCSSGVSSTPTATPYQIFYIADTIQDTSCESTDPHLIQLEVTGRAQDIEYIHFYNESYARIVDYDVTLPWSYSFCAPSGIYLELLVHTFSANVSVAAKIFIDGDLFEIKEEYCDKPHVFVTVDGWVP